MNDAQKLATEVIVKLARAGYEAYFAGGWVRDFILGHPSDDIDIATNAPPQKIMDLFPRTILVGLAFGIVVVIVEGHQFEVATFRRDIDYRDGRKPSSIELASAEEDAERRDFTINGMFYDPLENRIIDYVGGQKDLKQGIIRAIGNPDERFREDRLRMIRAVRFAARFGFAIDPDTEVAIRVNAPELFPSVAMERIWQEFTKMAAFPHFDRVILDLQRLNLLEVIFPEALFPTLTKIHLNTLKQLIASFEHFPKDCPTIVYLFELFPEASLDELISLCRYLRTSQKEIKLAEFFIKSHLLWGQNPFKIKDPVEAVHFYAHPDSMLYLKILEAKMPAVQRQRFRLFHEEQHKHFSIHIQRSQQRSPLVNATLLKAEGVPPGPEMGRLLALAEQFVIRHNMHRPEEVIKLLKNCPSWVEIRESK